MTNPTGLQWSLYPLLAIVALCEFVLGIGHLLLCLPFFPFLVPVVSGIFTLITAIHALFLRYPNRTDFALQCCSTIIGLTLLGTSAVETYCGLINEESISNNSTTISKGVCYGLMYRTAGHRGSCNDFLSKVHTSFTSKIGPTFHISSIRFALSLSITALAVVHFAICITLSFYSAVETSTRIRPYQVQLFVACLTIPPAFLHYSYCCTYFFVYPGFIVGGYAILQSAITWKFYCKGNFTRIINITGCALGMALAASASFGTFCTAARFGSFSVPFQRHCSWPSEKYDHCNRVIDFRDPYRHWRRENIIAEVAVAQIFANSSLCLIAFAHFFFSLKSAFSIEMD